MGDSMTPYITEQELKARLKELAAQISEDYKGKQVLMVSDHHDQP